jgi:predicted RNase H-like HicB family nuclease
MRINIEARFKAGIKFDEEAKVHVTFAPALGIYSQGETVIQAKAALEDAVRSFLCVAYNNRVLDECLQMSGFSVESPGCGSAVAGPGEYVRISDDRVLEDEKFVDMFDFPAEIALAVA